MAALIVVSNSVDIRSAPDCPSADQIVSQLRPLLPSGPSPGLARDMAFLDVAESRPDGAVGFDLRLLRPDGTMVGHRRLVLQAGCEEMADAVAGIIAAWETELLQVSDAVPIGVGRSTNVTSNPAPTRLSLELGISVGAAFVGGTAATGSIEAVAGSNASRWQWRIAAASETARTVNLDVGEVRWRHTTGSAGLMFRSLGSPWRFSADLDVLVGWASLDGRGYSPSREQRSFEYGAAAGFRVRRGFGRFGVWAEVRTNLWSSHQRAVLTGSESRAELRNVDVMACVGGSAALFP
jgi:hypothetical protein